MIDDTQAEKAADYLRDSAEEIAQAKGNMIKAEAMLRHIKSLVMVASEEKSATAKEAEAYASPRYRQAIDDLFAATVAYEKHRALREAASQRIEVWRSQSANHRGRI